MPAAAAPAAGRSCTSSSTHLFVVRLNSVALWMHKLSTCQHTSCCNFAACPTAACPTPCTESCAVTCFQHMHSSCAQSAAHASMLLQGGGTVNDPGAMMRTREWGCLVSGCRDQETSADACPSGDKSQVRQCIIKPGQL